MYGRGEAASGTFLGSLAVRRHCDYSRAGNTPAKIEARAELRFPPIDISGLPRPSENLRPANSVSARVTNG